MYWKNNRVHCRTVPNRSAYKIVLLILGLLADESLSSSGSGYSGLRFAAAAKNRAAKPCISRSPSAVTALFSASGPGSIPDLQAVESRRVRFCLNVSLRSS